MAVVGREVLVGLGFSLTVGWKPFFISCYRVPLPGAALNMAAGLIRTES